MMQARMAVYNGAQLIWVPVNGLLRCAELLQAVLRGAQVGELPVQAPTKFDFAINLKVARTLGLSPSPSLVALADEVIE